MFPTELRCQVNRIWIDLINIQRKYANWWLSIIQRNFKGKNVEILRIKASDFGRVTIGRNSEIMQRVKRRSVKTSGLNAIRNVEKKTLNIVRNAWIKRIDRKQKNERNNKMKRLKILKQSKGGGRGESCPFSFPATPSMPTDFRCCSPGLRTKRMWRRPVPCPFGAQSEKKKKLIMKTGGNVAISAIKSWSNERIIKLNGKLR